MSLKIEFVLYKVKNVWKHIRMLLQSKENIRKLQKYHKNVIMLI